MEKIIKKNKDLKVLRNKINKFMVSYFNLLLALTVVIILSVGYFYVIGPKYQGVKEKISTVNEKLDQEYAKLTKYEKRLQEINANYDNTSKADIEKITQFLPEKPEKEDLIEKMELVAKKHGIFLSSLTVSGGEGPAGGESVNSLKSVPAGVGQVTITMNLSGVSYEGMKNFLATLEKSLRLMDIIRIDYSPDAETLSMQVLTYYYK